VAKPDCLFDGKLLYQNACHEIVDLPRDRIKSGMVFQHGKIPDGQRVGDQRTYSPPMGPPVIKDLKGQRSSPHTLHPMEHSRIFKKTVSSLLSGSPHLILNISGIRI